MKNIIFSLYCIASALRLLILQHHSERKHTLPELWMWVHSLYSGSRGLIESQTGNPKVAGLIFSTGRKWKWLLLMCKWARCPRFAACLCSLLTILTTVKCRGQIQTMYYQCHDTHTKKVRSKCSFNRVIRNRNPAKGQNPYKGSHKQETNKNRTLKCNVTLNKDSVTMTEQTGYKYTDTNNVSGNSWVQWSMMRQTGWWEMQFMSGCNSVGKRPFVDTQRTPTRHCDNQYLAFTCQYIEWDAIKKQIIIT